MADPARYCSYPTKPGQSTVGATCSISNKVIEPIIQLLCAESESWTPTTAPPGLQLEQCKWVIKVYCNTLKAILDLGKRSDLESFCYESAGLVTTVSAHEMGWAKNPPSSNLVNRNLFSLQFNGSPNRGPALTLPNGDPKKYEAERYIRPPFQSAADPGAWRWLSHKELDKNKNEVDRWTWNPGFPDIYSAVCGQLQFAFSLRKEVATLLRNPSTTAQKFGSTLDQVRYSTQQGWTADFVPEFKRFLAILEDFNSHIAASVVSNDRTWLDAVPWLNEQMWAARRKVAAATSAAEKKKRKDMMGFLHTHSGQHVAELLQVFQTLEDKRGYDYLNEMRGWYCQTEQVNKIDPNPDAETWGFGLRVAMDAILHQDENTDGDEHWLLKWDCPRANLLPGEYDLVKEQIRKKSP